MSFIPHPLRRLQIYAQREEIAKRVFNGHMESVYLHASCPTIQSLTTYGGVPEVIIMGRANVGKSTLVNEVFKRRGLANLGKNAGVTQCLNFYRLRKMLRWNSPEFFLVDAPGYGDRGRTEWGRLFHYYIQNRQELRSVFIVINAEHGVTPYDKVMLENLETVSQLRGFTLQAILSKCDLVPKPLLPQVVAHRQRVLSECAPSCLHAIPTAASKRATFGFQDVRHAILEACGFIQPMIPP